VPNSASGNSFGQMPTRAWRVHRKEARYIIQS
jgi:hypothetical protein